jgi:hypothetical protein
MEGMMPTELRFVTEPADGRPRTIAHALDILRVEIGLSELDTARISVGPMLLPSNPARSFCLIAKKEEDDITHAVLLPACAKVRAIQTGFSAVETFNIEDLHQATVDSTGTAVLTNGLEVRAIEAEAVPLPYELSERDCQIIRVLIQTIDGAEWAYRSLRQDLPLKYQGMVPDHRFIDFFTLKIGIAERRIKIPPLKILQYEVSKRFQVSPTLAKISDTLRKTGIRSGKSMRAKDTFLT